MILLYIIVVVLAFISGYALCRARGAAERWPFPGEEEEAKPAKGTEVSEAEEDRAFAALLGYNADTAYGVKK